jgi:hypothetical protein
MDFRGNSVENQVAAKMNGLNARSFITEGATGGDFWEAFRGEAPARPITEGWRGWGQDWTQRTAKRSVIGTGIRGGASAFLPIEPVEDLGGRIAKGAGGQAFGRAFSLVGKWMGPVLTTVRLGTEVNISQQGWAGAASKTGRIMGEEAAWSAGMAGGSVLGAKIGAGLGTMVAPGIGSAVGFVAGVAIGAGLGAAGSWAWNKSMDIAEAPVRLAHAGWKYFEAAGKRSTKMELGGRASFANRTQIAHTMRARALQNMSRSGINARSLLGQEASYAHIR